MIPEGVRIVKGDKVNLVPGMPSGVSYHCSCEFCQKVIGELRPADGSYYSRLERRSYYDKSESGKGGHINKTPLHAARWAIQQYTKKGDWVLDPTVGAGTTIVEALTQGRNAAGMELQFADVLRANVGKALSESFNEKNTVESVTRIGDARNVGKFLREACPGVKFALVNNNPPYSGDESDGGMGANHPLKGQLKYKDGLPNLAFLREGKEYWDTLEEIYSQCADALKPGGRFTISVKDMIRKGQPFTIHRDLAILLAKIGLEHEGTAFLKHSPTTLHLNTYFKRTGVHPPYYQTIVVMRKKGGRR